MQSAISFQSQVTAAPDADMKSGGTQFGKAKKQLDTGFSYVMNREIDKANEGIKAKNTPERKQDNKKSIKNDIPDEMAASALGGSAEKRNDFKAAENDNGAVAEVAANDREVSAQGAEETKTYANAARELLELLKSPEAKEFFDILNVNAEPEEKIDVGELIAALEGSGEDDVTPDFMALVRDVVDRIENGASENRTVKMPEPVAAPEQEIKPGKDTVSELYAVLEKDTVSEEAPVLKPDAEEEPDIRPVHTEDAAQAINIRKAIDVKDIRDIINIGDIEDMKGEEPEIASISPVMDFGAKLSKILHELDSLNTEEPVLETDEMPAEDAAAMPVPADESEDTKESDAGGQNGNMGAGEKADAAGLKKPAVLDAPASNQTFAQAAEKLPNVQTAAPAAANAQVPVDVRAVINQIVESMSYNTAQGMSRMEINLAPEFLGKLSVVLTSTPDGMTASIKAASESVRMALAANIAELENSLKANGINMRGINVTNEELSWDFSRGGQENAAGNNFERRGKFGENLRNISGKNELAGDKNSKIRPIDANNNYNIDRLNQMGSSIDSLTGSVEFLA